jgi:glycylpeptide N-tetradecanoyltransferase
MVNHIKRNKLPKSTDIALKGFAREMQKKDISQVYKLLQEHFDKFALRPKLK